MIWAWNVAPCYPVVSNALANQLAMTALRPRWIKSTCELGSYLSRSEFLDAFFPYVVFETIRKDIRITRTQNYLEWRDSPLKVFKWLFGKTLKIYKIKVDAPAPSDKSAGTGSNAATAPKSSAKAKGCCGMGGEKHACCSGMSKSDYKSWKKKKKASSAL